MRDRDLVRLYWPKDLRPAFDALFDIYDALGSVVVRSTEPTLAAIKLAWWRERLDELDLGKEPPAEPRLRAAAAELVARGISGSDLAGLEAGWATWLEEGADQGASFPEIGVHLFSLGARLLNLNPEEPVIARIGRIFVIVDAARRGLHEVGAAKAGRPWVPRKGRPLTALGALAARDLRRGGPPFEPEATPGRAWTLLRHRLTGHI